MTLGSAEVKRLLAQAGVVPRKSLGQNFVIDPNTVRRIAGLAEVGPGSQVVEIGAGLGSLTLALAQTGASVLAIETDPKLVGAIKGVLADMSGNTPGDMPGHTSSNTPGQVTVLHADARTLDWAQVLGPASSNLDSSNSGSSNLGSSNSGSWDLVANLPYNIATSLVLKVLDEAPQVQRLLVMCQREAAERLAADTGQSAYGAVSVRVRMHGEAKLVGAVPATVFWPEPAVESALVRITRDRELDATTTQALRLLLRQTFGRRRKMLRRSLRGGEVGIDSGTAQAWLSAAGVDELARPEQLNFEQWVALAKVCCDSRNRAGSGNSADSGNNADSRRGTSAK